jgi:hypothetical protein
MPRPNQIPTYQKYPEHWNRVLLMRVIDRRLGLEEILQRQPMGFDKFPKSEGFDEVG